MGMGGFVWDLIQQCQLSNANDRQRTLDERVEHLEGELRRTREILEQALRRIESRLGADINGDGQVG